MTDFRALCAELADALERLHKQSVTAPHTQFVELSNGRHPIPLGTDVLTQDLMVNDLLDRARAVLARYGSTPTPVPVKEPAGDFRYEFSVFDGEDEEQAGGEASTLEQAQREGRHYLAQYEADEGGPYRLELREVRVIPAHAIPTPENTDD